MTIRHWRIRSLFLECTAFPFIPLRQGLLWTQPGTLLRKMSGRSLGLARRTIDDAVAILRAKTGRLGQQNTAGHPRIQSAVAGTEMQLVRARSYVFQALECQWQ
ncbi:MAG: alkylation response protein AidB-like acyl-CoA dehydrogenase [Candidatus Azotimanducaceae bacterium]|jgi:alkylation response protein AidB-like acyl-CoA dehydrogenase